jgi:DHA1 family multidrug resistance protein-like MFS transporter
MLMTGAAEGLWVYILPVHIRSLGASPTQVGMTLSARGISILVSFLPAGLLADRFSRRKMMIILSTISILPTAILGLADRWEQIMLLFALVAMGWSTMPIYQSYLAHSTSPEKVNRVFSTIQSAYLLGLVLFRTVGAWIAAQEGMQPVFLLASLFLIISILPLFSLTEQPASNQGARVDYRPLLSNRTFLATASFTLLVLLGVITGSSLIPNYLEEEIGLDLVSIGRLGTLTVLSGAVLTLLIGRISGSGGFRVSLLGSTVAYAFLFLAPQGFGLIFTFILLGLVEPVFALILARMAQAVPLHLSGAAFGVQGAVIGMSILTAPMLAGVLYQWDPRRPIIFAVGILVVLTIGAVRWRPTLRESDSS